MFWSLFFFLNKGIFETVCNKEEDKERELLKIHKKKGIKIPGGVSSKKPKGEIFIKILKL